MSDSQSFAHFTHVGLAHTNRNDYALPSDRMRRLSVLELPTGAASKFEVSSTKTNLSKADTWP